MHYHQNYVESNAHDCKAETELQLLTEWLLSPQYSPDHGYGQQLMKNCGMNYDEHVILLKKEQDNVL